MLFYIEIAVSLVRRPGRDWEVASAGHPGCWESVRILIWVRLHECAQFMKSHWAVHLGYVHILLVCMLKGFL